VLPIPRGGGAAAQRAVLPGGWRAFTGDVAAATRDGAPQHPWSGPAPEAVTKSFLSLIKSLRVKPDDEERA